MSIHIPTSAMQARTSPRERIGISLGGPDIQQLLAAIVEAERAGVTQLWLTQNPISLDSLTVFAAAFGRTERIRLGTSIVPTYPRHPLALAQQAATVAALGPGRLRLGVGPSHRPAIEPTYGVQMIEPLAHLREYVEILRAVLWEGAVDYNGRFLTARAEPKRVQQIPLLISALGAQAFELGGQIADGAISWNTPSTYLHDVALPALRAGAAANQRPTPTLVAHFWVSLETDRAATIAATKQTLTGYARLPFYANMFAASGYPIVDGAVSDALAETLLVQGNADQVAQQLTELLDSGLDELLLTPVPLDDITSARTRLFRVVGQLG